MKIAIPTWNQRVAPVFDVSRTFALLEVESGAIHSQQVLEAPTTMAQRVKWLKDQDVQTLICGAISCFVREQLIDAGIRVVPFVAGDLSDIAHAWLQGTLSQSHFSMPGCGGGRRGSRQGPGRGAGRGRGGGRGRGPGCRW